MTKAINSQKDALRKEQGENKAGKEE